MRILNSIKNKHHRKGTRKDISFIERNSEMVYEKVFAWRLQCKIWCKRRNVSHRCLSISSDSLANNFKMPDLSVGWKSLIRRKLFCRRDTCREKNKEQKGLG